MRFRKRINESHLGGHPQLLAAAVAGRDRLLDRRPHGLLVVVEQSLERVQRSKEGTHMSMYGPMDEISSQFGHDVAPCRCA